LLETESHLYVERGEDDQVIKGVRRGDYVALIGARQTGKTSLLLRLRRRLLDEGHMPVYLDLSPARNEDEEAWYRYLRSVVLFQLKRVGAGVSVPPIGDRFDLREALMQVSLELPSSRHVVFLIDEMGALPRGIAERFLSMLRTIYNEREAFPEFRRYVFVMAGAFIPEELVGQPSISPFNVASRVYTGDADRDGLAPLVHNLESVGYRVSDEVINGIHGWTGGHPYLTQRLCSLLERRRDSHLTLQLVDTAADDALGDRNIGRVYDNLDRLPEERRVLHRVLVRDDPLRFNRASPLIARLELVGVIKPDTDGYCTVRNAIYERALTNVDPGCFADEAQEMMRSEQELYEYFSENVARTCTYAEIAEALWGSGSLAEADIENRIYQLVTRLRRRVASDGTSALRIITVWGRGYRPQLRA
jgi:hypothetical protein